MQCLPEMHSAKANHNHTPVHYRNPLSPKPKPTVFSSIKTTEPECTRSPFGGNFFERSFL